MEVIETQPEIDYVKIGQRIRAARLEKGYSQADLGALVGCSNNHMSHVEVGQTKVSLAMLLKLAKIEPDFFINPQFSSRFPVILTKKGCFIMSEEKLTMDDFSAELEASFKKIEEGDMLTGTVISVDEKEVILDLKYYAEGVIRAEDFSNEPGFSLKESRRARRSPC